MFISAKFSWYKMYKDRTAVCRARRALWRSGALVNVVEVLRLSCHPIGQSSSSCQRQDEPWAIERCWDLMRMWKLQAFDYHKFKVLLIVCGGFLVIPSWISTFSLPFRHNLWSRLGGFCHKAKSLKSVPANIRIYSVTQLLHYAPNDLRCDIVPPKSPCCAKQHFDSFFWCDGRITFTELPLLLEGQVSCIRKIQRGPPSLLPYILTEISFYISFSENSRFFWRNTYDCDFDYKMPL